MVIRKLAILILMSGFLSTLTPSVTLAAQTPQSSVVKAQDVNWGYLNPLRGDKSPAAANLWGDRTKDQATGMLVKFNKGFSSPPHIHNISYRGVVIHGQLHNADPNAAKMWMSTGSYWTQPAGGDHITAANGDSNMIYLEIEGGPYLVKPSKQAFNNGEKPLNLDAANIVWQNQQESKLIESNQAQIASLWQHAKGAGYLIKFKNGFKGKITTDASEFRAVVIKGQINYQSTQNPQTTLTAGSYISSTGQFEHRITTEVETTIYIRKNGAMKVL